MFKLSTHEELMCKAEGQGSFFAKKGAMIADQGQFKYSKRLLGTNGGNILGQVLNHAVRKITGENLEVMEVQGSGIVYLADQGAHCIVIDLEANGIWNSVCVESENLLAFTDTCHYGVTPVGVGVISQRGLFSSKLSHNGAGAQVVIKSEGNPLILQAPCRVDPDAVVAWTGASPKVKIDINWKTIIGQASGESYMLEFTEPGQMVIVQPFERESGVKIAIDDKRHQPETQGSAGQNTMDNLRNSLGNLGGSQNADNGNNPAGTGGVGGIVGNILGNLRR